MAQTATLFRFRIELSDIDRGSYETLDMRVAMHPSESPLFLVTRVLAFALNHGEGLVFSPDGLSDPDQPCMKIMAPNGGMSLWIEIGNPSARKLHKAAKASHLVKVYTYKNPDLLLKEIKENRIHNSELLEIYSFGPHFLEKLTQILQRDNRWGVIVSEGSLMISHNEELIQGEMQRHSL